MEHSSISPQKYFAKPLSNKLWMPIEILDLCDRRRSLKKRRNDDPVGMQCCSEVDQEIGRRMKEAKENWITD